MKYCPFCGKEISEDDTFCRHCGKSLTKGIAAKEEEPPASFLWGVLGFISPVIGFIIFLVYHNSKPDRASKVGWGTLIGAIFCVIMYFILIAYPAVPEY